MAYKTVRRYYPASRYAGTEQERNAQFRGARGGLYDVKFIEVPDSCDTCTYKKTCELRGDLVTWCKSYAEL